MNLKKQIEEDIKKAMKARDQNTLNVLRFLLSQIKQKEIDMRPNDLSDFDRLKVIQKQVQKLKDSLDQFKNAKREDLIQNAEEELKIYRKYLPKPMGDQELKLVVQKSIEDLKAQSIQQMGPVIKEVLAKTQGRAENKAISQMVRACLLNEKSPKEKSH